MLVMYNGLNLYKAAGLTFIPGANRIEDDVWTKAKQHPLVAHRVETGVLEEVAPTVETDEAEDTNLKGQTEKAAIGLINKTIDAELLKKWLEGEDRPKVKAAIEARLTAIDPAKTEDDNKQ